MCLFNFAVEWCSWNINIIWGAIWNRLFCILIGWLKHMWHLQNECDCIFPYWGVVGFPHWDYFHIRKVASSFHAILNATFHTNCMLEDRKVWECSTVAEPGVDLLFQLTELVLGQEWNMLSVLIVSWWSACATSDSLWLCNLTASWLEPAAFAERGFRSRVPCEGEDSPSSLWRKTTHQWMVQRVAAIARCLSIDCGVEYLEGFTVPWATLHHEPPSQSPQNTTPTSSNW